MLTVPLQQMLNEMDHALTEEIKAQKNKTSSRKVAFDGKPLSEQSNHYLYTFSLDEPWEPQDDTPVTIKIQGSLVKATLVNSKGMTITIATETPLPVEALHRIELFDDSTRLLENLREALKHNDEGNSQLGSKSFGLIPFNKGKQLLSITFGEFTPDNSQEQALHMALGSEVTYIIGPPGTGKTSTLAAIAFAHLRQGRTVLVAAHTNIAVDNAIMKLCEICHKTGATAELQDGHIVRYGTPHHKSLSENREYEDVYLPKIARRRGNQLHQQREGLEISRKQIVERLEKYTHEQAQAEAPLQAEMQNWSVQCETSLRKFEQLSKEYEAHQALSRGFSTQLQSAERNLNVIRSRRDQLEVEQIQAQTERSWLISQVERLNVQLSQAQLMNRIRRFLKGINQKRLGMQLGNAKQRLWQMEQTLTDVVIHLDNAYRDYGEVENECERLKRKFNNVIKQQIDCEESLKRIHSSIEQCKQRIAEIDAILQQNRQNRDWERDQLDRARADIEEKIAVIDRQIADLEKSIVDNAHVVATTLSKIYMAQILQKRRFDIVILDEVSMAPLPAVYLAASRANTSVVAIGDPHQLAPIVNAQYSPVAQKWLGKDLFWHNKITLDSATQVYRNSENTKNSTLLREQSRMHHKISKIAREHVYQERVQDATRLNDRGSDYLNLPPSPGNPLLLCDTSDGSPIVTKPAGGSRINFYHALCTMALVQQVLASPLPQNDQNNAEQRVGIVTPYAPQARLLQRMIRGAGLEQVVRVGTVHRFQGLEFDIVIFDTVESPDAEPVKDFTAGTFGSNAMRLINVAITRARHKLIIVANVSYLRRKLRDDDILYKVVMDAQAVCTIKSQEVLQLPFPSPNEIVKNVFSGAAYGRVLQELPKVISEIEFFNAQSFYVSFKRDLQSAKEAIVIFSPYVGSKRVKELLPLISEKLKAGVQVTVVTKPPSEMTNDTAPEAMRLLKNALGTIQERDKMHEKLVIVDKEIVYLGSLNVFSQGESSEIMIRVRSLNFANEIERCINMHNLAKVSSVQRRPARRKGPNIELPLAVLPSAASSCNVCGASMRARIARKNESLGPFYGCENYKSHPQEKSIVDVSVDHFRQIQQLVNRSCVQCGSPTNIEKNPKQNGFLICTSCDYIQEIIFE